jgi:hypothetical protein
MIDPPRSVAKLKVLRVNLYVGLSACPCAIRYLLQILFSGKSVFPILHVKVAGQLPCNKPFATFLHYIYASVNTGETSSSPVKTVLHL